MTSDPLDLERYPELVAGDTFLDFTATSAHIDIARVFWGRDWSMLAQAYFEAADTVVTSAIDAGDHSRHAFPQEIVAPALYLYRHWLELQLKNIMQVARQYDEWTGPDRGHRLQPLWGEARKYFELRWPSHDEILNTIERNIELLSEMDERSTLFRYPDDEPPTDWYDVEVDLRRMRQVFRAIHLWLAGVEDARDAEAQAESDFYSDYSGDMDFPA